MVARSLWFSPGLESSIICFISASLGWVEVAELVAVVAAEVRALAGAGLVALDGVVPCVKAIEDAAKNAVNVRIAVFMARILSKGAEGSQAWRSEGRGQRSVCSQIPKSCNWWVATADQSRFAAGLAGVGCKMRASRIGSPPKNCVARFAAKSPRPTGHSGAGMRT